MAKPPPIPLYPEAEAKRGPVMPWRTMGIWAAIFLLLASLTTIAVFWVKSNLTHAGYSSSLEHRQIIVRGELLRIPENMIRFAEQRKAVTLSRIELVLHWPSGDGFSESKRAAFEDISADQKLIFLSIGNRKMRHSMTERLAPIYKALFDGQPRQGPAGLTLQGLKRGAGYDGEELALGADGDLLWVARCQLASGITPPTCLRDIHVGRRLSAQIRFPRKLLSEWRGIEKLIQERFFYFSTR